MEFVYEAAFTRVADELLTDEILIRLEVALEDNPTVGVVIPGTGGARKWRVALPGRGKSGSARAIYLYVPVRYRIYFLRLYMKNKQGNLSQNSIRELAAIVAQIKEEG